MQVNVDPNSSSLNEAPRLGNQWSPSIANFNSHIFVAYQGRSQTGQHELVCAVINENHPTKKIIQNLVVSEGSKFVKYGNEITTFSSGGKDYLAVIWKSSENSKKIYLKTFEIDISASQAVIKEATVSDKSFEVGGSSFSNPTITFDSQPTTDEIVVSWEQYPLRGHSGSNLKSPDSYELWKKHLAMDGTTYISKPIMSHSTANYEAVGGQIESIASDSNLVHVWAEISGQQPSKVMISSGTKDDHDSAKSGFAVDPLSTVPQYDPLFFIYNDVSTSTNHYVVTWHTDEELKIKLFDTSFNATDTQTVKLAGFNGAGSKITSYFADVSVGGELSIVWVEKSSMDGKAEAFGKFFQFQTDKFVQQTSSFAVFENFEGPINSISNTYYDKSGVKQVAVVAELEETLTTADLSNVELMKQFISPDKVKTFLTNNLTAEKTVTLTRGSVANATDLLPDSSKVTNLLSVTDTPTSPSVTYVVGSDFLLTNGYVDWAPAGAEPTANTTYTVKYRYELAPDIRSDFTIMSDLRTFYGLNTVENADTYDELIDTDLIQILSGKSYVLDLLDSDDVREYLIKFGKGIYTEFYSSQNTQPVDSNQTIKLLPVVDLTANTLELKFQLNEFFDSGAVNAQTFSAQIEFDVASITFKEAITSSIGFGIYNLNIEKISSGQIKFEGVDVTGVAQNSNLIGLKFDITSGAASSTPITIKNIELDGSSVGDRNETIDLSVSGSPTDSYVTAKVNVYAWGSVTTGIDATNAANMSSGQKYEVTTAASDASNTVGQIIASDGTALAAGTVVQSIPENLLADVKITYNGLEYTNGSSFSLLASSNFTFSISKETKLSNYDLIEANDALQAYSISNGTAASSFTKSIADFDGNGSITTADVQAILDFSTGIRTFDTDASASGTQQPSWKFTTADTTAADADNIFTETMTTSDVTLTLYGGYLGDVDNTYLEFYA